MNRINDPNRKTQVLVLSGDGLNCERETAQAFDQAGAQTVILTVRQLIANPTQLFSYDILVLPGGFSYADDLGSGSVLALKLQMALGDELRRFNQEGRAILGICNGFQVLVRLGLLPFDDYFGQGKPPEVTLAANSSGTFINAWVKLRIPENASLFMRNLSGKTFYLPIRHGEGRLVASSPKLLAKIKTMGLVAMEYCENINGSSEMIAALSNAKGNVLGMMPHPEAALDEALIPEGLSSGNFSFSRELFSAMVSHYEQKHDLPVKSQNLSNKQAEASL